jgi:hypothetical protein
MLEEVAEEKLVTEVVDKVVVEMVPLMEEILEQTEQIIQVAEEVVEVDLALEAVEDQDQEL